MANRSVSFTVKSQDDDDFYTPGHYGISFERKENTKEVRATFTHTGHYTVRMTVEDDGCGNIYQERTIDVLEGMEAPQIALVTVDPTTGKTGSTGSSGTFRITFPRSASIKRAATTTNST